LFTGFGDYNPTGKYTNPLFSAIQSYIHALLRAILKTILEVFMKALRLLIILVVMVVLAGGSLWAADLSKPKGTVSNIRQADPPQVSTTTKPSPVGQPVSDYKPKGPSVHPKEPPPPATTSKPAPKK
jgi:hypothetical protein